MISRICCLPLEVANQIAAGEVIERPASVVKELLENALDAGASQIQVDIGHGGLNQIKITDNGHGILAEDLPLAIAPHATSKISSLDDLTAIYSLGFRGEALASIASVSRLSISSKSDMDAHGSMLDCSSFPLKGIVPVARNKGTTIDVLDIFYNAPVRKKFLKTAQLEFLAIDALVRRFALARHDISVTLNHNGKTHWQVKASETPICLTRISRLLGRTFAEHSICISHEQSGMRLTGFAGDKNCQRSQNDKTWVYLNGRMLKDRLILHAVRKAYETLLHPGKHPACVLYLSMDPALVDVNVHPAKHEVRFENPRMVHDFICSALRNALVISEESETAEITDIKPKRPLSPPHMPLPGRFFWKMLNARFALIHLDGFRLIDALSLKKKYTEMVLAEVTLPLKKRPLLVPLALENMRLDGNLAALLESFGMDIKQEEGQFFLRTIPVILPDLNIREFMNALVRHQEIVNEQSIKELLSVSQSFHPESFDDLADFIYHHPDFADTRLMSEVNCVEFMYGSKDFLLDGTHSQR